MYLEFVKAEEEMGTDFFLGEGGDKRGGKEKKEKRKKKRKE